MQVLSVICKLIVPAEMRPEIDATLQGFADACNQILGIAKENNCWNTTKLHHLSYKPVRASVGLGSNHVCMAIRRVVGNANLTKQIHKFKPTSVSLNVHTFRYIEAAQSVKITLNSGRSDFKLAVGGYQIALLKGQALTSATLSKTRKGDYYISFVVEVDTPPTGKTPKVIGVDLGRRDIAHTSTGKSWDGEQIQKTRSHFAKVRASVQSKGTKGAKRLLKRLSGKEQRFQKWLNHTISRRLVDEAKAAGAALAFEDLTGIRQRAKVRGKDQRRQHNSWAFYQLRLFTHYKAAIAGVSMLLVNPAYTSKTCHHCLHIGKRDAKSFKCENCGWHGDADFNAANVIGLLGAAVSQPERSILACVLQS